MDNEDIFAAHIFLDFYERLAVGKRLNGRFPQFNSDISADGLGQRSVGGAAKNLHKISVLSLKQKPTESVEEKQDGL